jgi:separase
LFKYSPAVVSNLWDVTDRSIDKLTKQFLKNWGMFEKRKTPRTTLVLADQQNTVSLVQAVADSRNHCNLPFLIGKCS